MKRTWVLIILAALLTACERRVHLTGRVDWGGGGSTTMAGDGGSGVEPQIVFVSQPADAGLTDH